MPIYYLNTVLPRPIHNHDQLLWNFQIVDLDVKRNRNREALNALQKDTDPGE